MPDGTEPPHFPVAGYHHIRGRLGTNSRGSSGIHVADISRGHPRYLISAAATRDRLLNSNVLDVANEAAPSWEKIGALRVLQVHTHHAGHIHGPHPLS